jgi:uncharacterized protein
VTEVANLWPQIMLGIAVGFVAGAMGGAFGVGGAILTTPATQVLLGQAPIVAVGTPLPVIFPTTLSGMQAYRRAGEIDHRAVKWAAIPGAAGAVVGAVLTKWIDARILLLATAALIAWQAIRVGRGADSPSTERPDAKPSGLALALTGLGAGFASGLLGIGGGVVMVPVMSGILGMPLKRVIGTSLVVIAVMVIPGTLVHALLGHINWAVFLWLTIGVIPGAAVGSRWTLRAKERTLRLVVATFLSAVAISYGAFEIHALITGT